LAEEYGKEIKKKYKSCKNPEKLKVLTNQNLYNSLISTKVKISFAVHPKTYEQYPYMIT